MLLASLRFPGAPGFPPGEPQPEYIVKDAWPDACWTYPPVARFSGVVSALARVATATKPRNVESFAMAFLRRLEVEKS